MNYDTTCRSMTTLFGSSKISLTEEEHTECCINNNNKKTNINLLNMVKNLRMFRSCIQVGKITWRKKKLLLTIQLIYWIIYYKKIYNEFQNSFFISVYCLHSFFLCFVYQRCRLLNLVVNNDAYLLPGPLRNALIIFFQLLMMFPL